MIDRRLALAALMLAASGSAAQGNKSMYGRVGKMKAVPGQREALLAALQAGSRDMPGNLDYAIARDAADPDGLWIWERWISAESHRASLALPQVKHAITIGRPLIAAFDITAELVF